jgi:hypothetical protein
LKVRKRDGLMTVGREHQRRVVVVVEAAIPAVCKSPGVNLAEGDWRRVRHVVAVGGGRVVPKGHPVGPGPRGADGGRKEAHPRRQHGAAGPQEPVLPVRRSMGRCYPYRGKERDAAGRCRPEILQKCITIKAHSGMQDRLLLRACNIEWCRPY